MSGEREEPTCDEVRSLYTAALAIVSRLRVERDDFKANYNAACRTVALMHEAAIGEIACSRRGVVEDVKELRRSCDEAKGKLAVIRREMECSSCTDGTRESTWNDDEQPRALCGDCGGSRAKGIDGERLLQILEDEVPR